LQDDEIAQSCSSLNSDLADVVKNRPDGLAIPAIVIIKFVVLCYDKESPLIEQYRKRWTLRKKFAAEYSGLIGMSKSYKEDVDAILYASNTTIAKLIIRYLSLLNDRDFLAYAVYSELLTKQSEQLLRFNFDRPSDAQRAKQNMETIQADLTSLEEKIFSGGDVRTLKNVLQEESTRFMVTDLRPENIVTKLENGEPIVDENPYGEGYEIKKPIFLGEN